MPSGPLKDKRLESISDMHFNQTIVKRNRSGEMARSVTIRIYSSGTFYFSIVFILIVIRSVNAIGL